MYLTIEQASVCTEDELLEQLKQSFLKFDFKLEENNFTTRPYGFKVSRNNLMFELKSTISDIASRSSSLSFFVSSFGKNILGSLARYVKDTTAVNAEVSRFIPLMIIRFNDDVIVNIGDYNLSAGKGLYSFCDCISKSGINIVGAINGNNLSFYNAETLALLTSSPYHSYGKNDSVLFIDPELPFIVFDTNKYLDATTGLTGLGGSTSKQIYTSDLGDKYYSYYNNLGIKMGEQITLEG